LNNEARVILSEHSTPDQVAEWLMEKGFSMRTMNVLEEQTGATLFALTKSKLQDFCGKEEGQRLYSQLLVQKNKTGYNTKSGAELKAILNLRKRQVEGRQQQQQQRAMSTLDEEMVNDLSAIDVVIDQDHHNQQQQQRQQQQYQPSTSSPDHTVRVYN
jgi:tRNA A22 N-methylase